MSRPRSLLWAFLALAGVYLYFFPYFERLNNPNENVRIYLVRSLVDHHTLAIDPILRDWGYVNDRSAFQGRNYSAKAPGTSLTGVPVYFVQRLLFRAAGWKLTKARVTYAVRLFAVTLPTLLFLWFLGRFLERRGASPFARDVTVLGLGLGTPLLAYGVVFVAHAQVVVTAFGSFMLARRAAELDWEGVAPRAAVAWRLTLGGLLAGWATLTEYQVAPVSLVLMLYAFLALRHRRRVVWFGLGAVPPAAVLFLYNYLCFGGILEFSYAHLENAAFAHNTAQGLMGFRAPKLSVLGAELFGQTNGLFFFSPLLGLGFVGLLVALGRRGTRLEGAASVLSFALPTLLLAGHVVWRGGWSIGTRYVTVVVPFAAYGVALLLMHLRGRRAFAPVAGAAAALCMVSWGIAGIAVIYPHYPEQLTNPTFQLAWPLVREGYLPYSAGYLAGLRGLAAALPLLPFIGLALFLVLASEGSLVRRLVHVLCAGAVAAGLLWLASRDVDLGYRHARTAHFVRSYWEPRAGLPPLPPPPSPPGIKTPPRRTAHRPPAPRPLRPALAVHLEPPDLRPPPRRAVPVRALRRLAPSVRRAATRSALRPPPAYRGWSGVERLRLRKAPPARALIRSAKSPARALTQPAKAPVLPRPAKAPGTPLGRP